MAQQHDSRAPEPDDPLSADGAGANGVEKDAGVDSAAPYGTRSRNRSGNPRPNYAEDKDIEMDNYDYYDKKENDGTKKSSRLAASATANGDSARGPGSRKPAAEDSKAAPAQNGTKESNATAAPISQSAQPAASRKRKAAASGQSSATSTAAPSRRAGNATPTGATNWPDSNMLTFENCKGMPKNGQLIADDGTTLEPNDHVYLVCEPPGEPYYLGRIMEFLHSKNDPTRPVDALRMNWYYRPKEIGRKSTDTRLLYATMHSDISPLTALRGKCQIQHRVEIPNLEEYRKTPDSFWYEKLYDRYIQKSYDLIPTSTIVNVPDRVKKVLDERWKFVLVEQGRSKELTSAVKLCKRCAAYCASNESVDCAVCKNTYHMNCVSPPLLKKPSRGFGWSCAACSRAQERKLEARLTTDGAEGDEDDVMDEDEDDLGADTNRTTPTQEVHHAEGTPEQIYQASLWPYRYLGVHCSPEDALDYDDRIYPRASTRIGPRHQANVLPYPGQPVEYVKPIDVRRGKKGGQLSKDQLAALEAEKAKRSSRPKWVQDEPPGYTVRGEDHDFDDPDCTSIPMWIRPPEDKPPMKEVIAYMDEARPMAKKLDLPNNSTNLQDVALTSYLRHDYDAEKALESLPTLPRAEFDEPKLTSTDEKKFDEAVSKYGSELHLVMKHVKTMTPGQVVRYYYTWKKSERGSKVWSSYSGRKGKKQAKLAEAAASKIADDVADKDDDSAFDSNKAAEKKRTFICQFCSTTTSRQWRRAPNATQAFFEDPTGKGGKSDKANQAVVALCRRCAELWRRYAIRWEDVEEVAKKVAQAGGKAWKKKQDEELLKELQAVQDLGLTPDRDSTPLSGIISAAGLEPPRKKLKGGLDKEFDASLSDAGSVTTSTKRKDRTTESTPTPDMPKPRLLPCAVCDQLEPLGDQHVSCRECRLTVHRSCYGIMNNRVQGKWLCDMCANDKNPQVSVDYRCVLCPVEHTEQDFIEQPKLTHHKKKMSDKDREREKVEVQQARRAAELYRKRQEELNRPVNPREPLKRTADNNWVHVTCAVWMPEVKFGSSKALQPAEGIPSIPRSRYEETCKACNQINGACISCHHCRASYHVECAKQQGHLLAFDITPIKSSRRDQFSIVAINGESGTMSATLWCKDHVPTKTIVHPIHEVVDETGLTALQLFVRNYKQADIVLTGCVRKAHWMSSYAKVAPVHSSTGSRRTSGTTGANGAWANGTNGDAHDTKTEQPSSKVCISCGVDVTPKWWPIEGNNGITNGHQEAIGSEAQKFVEQRMHQCHKCKKMARTPRPPPPPPPPASQVPDVVDASRTYPKTSPHSSHLPMLRSPPQQTDYREPSSTRSPWPRTSPSPSDWPKHHASPPAVAAPLGGRYAAPPPPPPQAYSPAPPPRAAPYNDWNQRPTSQHGSPPRRYEMSAWPPGPPAAAPPPMPTYGMLRMPPNPPPSQGPPPPMHSNGLPPSPRRMGGPAPPSPYTSPYHDSHSHRQPLPGPVKPTLPPARDSFTHGLHPRGAPPYVTGAHGSPPPVHNGLHTAREPLPIPRAPETRPPSGASASPSLRNLLS